MIRVAQVNGSRRGMRDFRNLPYGLYQGEVNWCPPLRMERRRFFSRRNPYVRRNPMAFLVAYEGARPVGRVTAHVDLGHNRHYGTKDAFFGFFEAVERNEVAGALMERAEAWARSRGMTAVSGPYDFNTKQELGFLTMGFDEPQTLMMPYTKAYYPDQLHRLGYGRVKTLLMYRLQDLSALPEIVTRTAKRIEDRHGESVEITTFTSKDLRRTEEKEFILQVYNDAWSGNWGFIPMTMEDLDYLIRELKPIGDLDFFYKVRKDGEPAAVMLNLPDIYEILRRIPGGRLLPWGVFRLLFQQKAIRSGVIIIAGVRRKFHRQGIELMILNRLFEDNRRKGCANRIETTWVLEDNRAIIKTLENFHATLSRKLVILKKDLREHQP